MNMQFMDESFWVAVGFVIFLYFAYKPIKKSIISSLDSRINDIKTTLAEAEKIKADAKSLLEEVQKEMNDFEKYRTHILDNAKISTEQLITIRSREMDLDLARKSQNALMVIENEKIKASESLRNQFTDNVINMVRSYLTESKNNAISDEEIISKFIKPQKNEKI